ncbi:MAG: hypothetical protein COA68_17565 [Oceanobacter sp.]|nr:MAG: hypothetical protein COA68_17565 [Oceanobacter sp.]
MNVIDAGIRRFIRCLQDNRAISTKLLDRIENNTEFLNDLDNKIDLSIIEINISNTDVKNAIAELRKVDPKRAAELENSINLKSKKSKNDHNI